MGNLRVAVCDDEPMDLVQTITLIQQYDTGRCFDIFSYTRAVDLLKIALEKPFDVVLLDIEMETPNGYEIAKKLVMLPSPPVIIFVTKSSAYTLKGYGIALACLFCRS